MPRQKPRSLTKAELRIMQVLWKLRRGSVAEVVAAIPKPPLAYTTVLTMLRILEQKGAVKRELEGRAHIYFPAFEEDDAAGTAIGDVVRSFFADSKTALAMRLIAEEKPDRDELARIKQMIEAYEEGAS
ncbi:MAG TPA: BlaI/MecI/CopY family transcriptional regulator [Verrucomicrobiae bacterium]|nr:BlaI/MecI/CopY family transcriptional regulator [Verrucomicrobiae bacterium]HTZ54682.1 BlaI/MecI/CopY family transcriptional regulator [Candidatus Acidoferrum sp.]